MAERPATPPYAILFGFDADKIRAWLTWLNLGPGDEAQARILQDEVIKPNADRITAAFQQALMQRREFATELAKFDLERFRQVQTQGLLALGVGFDQPAYFNARLELGAFYGTQGAPVELYPSAFSLMQQIILGFIPAKIRADAAADNALVNFIVKIVTLDLSLAIAAFYLSKLNNLHSFIDSLEIRAAQLQHLVTRDRMTDLVNHDEILQSLDRCMATAKASRFALCVIMADIDHFKSVNDQHGHLAGDDVLRHVAERIRSSIRDFDIAGRYGGEEFLVVLPKTTLEEAQVVAERIRCKVAERPIHTHGHNISVTISLGGAALQDDADYASLARWADAALYAAKKAGRNQVVVERNGP